jgi:hypothetical protein
MYHATEWILNKMSVVSPETKKTFGFPVSATIVFNWGRPKTIYTFKDQSVHAKHCIS